jgi:hypothetical protein
VASGNRERFRASVVACAPGGRGEIHSGFWMLDSGFYRYFF